MQSINLSNGKRRIAGNVLIIFGGVMLTGSASAKLAHIPKVVAQLSAAGFDDNKLMFVAALEVLSAALFLIPQSRSIGLLMVSSFMGGAIATHLQHNEPIIQPAGVLIVLWLGAWLRHPEVLGGFTSATPSRSLQERQGHRERALG
jgi:hypothetical protein